MYEFLGAGSSGVEPLDGLTVPGFAGTQKRHPHYRSGRRGQWRKYFSERTTAWYLDEASSALEAHGYAVE
jgi:hypothetical protein